MALGRLFQFKTSFLSPELSSTSSLVILSPPPPFFSVFSELELFEGWSFCLDCLSLTFPLRVLNRICSMFWNFPYYTFLFVQLLLIFKSSFSYYSFSIGICFCVLDAVASVT